MLIYTRVYIKKGAFSLGKNLDKLKNDNIDKIKIGFCLELTFLFDNIENDILRFKNFISDNELFFNNQSVYTLNKNITDIQSILDNHVDIVLADVDKDEKFCEYSSKYY